MSKHRVLSPFPSKEPLKTGQIVDTSKWRNVERLVRQRYLGAVAEAVPAEAATQPETPEAATPSAPTTEPPAQTSKSKKSNKA